MPTQVSCDAADSIINAAQTGQLQQVNEALDTGADINTTGRDGNAVPFDIGGIGEHNSIAMTPLMLAAYNGHLEVARLLVERGANLANALSCAIRRDRVAVVRLLIDRGADVNENLGVTVLEWALKGGHLPILQLLADKGASLDFGDRNGRSPLAWVNSEVAKWLIGAGATVDARDQRWSRTALFWAVGEDDVEKAKLLLAAGADVNAEDLDGGTPISEATSDEMAELLEKAGAREKTSREQRFQKKKAALVMQICQSRVGRLKRRDPSASGYLAQYPAWFLILENLSLKELVSLVNDTRRADRLLCDLGLRDWSFVDRILSFKWMSGAYGPQEAPHSALTLAARPRPHYPRF